MYFQRKNIFQSKTPCTNVLVLCMACRRAPIIWAPQPDDCAATTLIWAAMGEKAGNSVVLHTSEAPPVLGEEMPELDAMNLSPLLEMATRVGRNEPRPNSQALLILFDDWSVAVPRLLPSYLKILKILELPPEPVFHYQKEKQKSQTFQCYCHQILSWYHWKVYEKAGQCGWFNYIWKKTLCA